VVNALRLSLRLVVLLSLTLSASLYAQQVDESYRLTVRDLVKFSVLDEPETALEQRIDGQGRIRIPYLGNVRIAGLTAREAEDQIEASYIAADIFRQVQVTIRVGEYSIKEVSVLGQVKRPGNVTFPIEANGLDLREVISQSGGFTNIAQTREVRVTRPQPDGTEEVISVNVERMLRARDGEGNSAFLVLPGDKIFVPERIF
jgi:polysaccharide biosynthesis/export protein